MVNTSSRRLCFFILALLMFLSSCSPDVPSVATVPDVSASYPVSVSPAPGIDRPPSESFPAQTVAPAASPSVPPGETLQVIVFDVGQADCILVKTGSHAMLIDAGDVGQGELILDYLEQYGVQSLDVLVATHPHSDHIGSMAQVIRAMDSIGTLLMPDAVHTTKTFENLLDAIEERDVPVAVAQDGDTFDVGGALVEVLAPIGTHQNLNDDSVVLRISYGQIVFLLTGDAEALSESEQLAKGYELSADVLKVGHHGSSSSSTGAYIDAVCPDYAVISCGTDNSYGHPHEETLSLLSGKGITFYRTDENGTVEFTTDGESLSIQTEREGLPGTDAVPTPDAAQQEGEPAPVYAYIGNINSKVFHKPACSTLPAERNRVYFTTKDEAESDGYRPCQRCKP